MTINKTSAAFLFFRSRLSVVTEDDEGMLEFRASAGDLVKGRLEREVSLRYGDAEYSLLVPFSSPSLNVLCRCHWVT